jgi:FKBP-type peptidyl-prolyl cis-trans isomerase FkpA
LVSTGSLETGTFEYYLPRMRQTRPQLSRAIRVHPSLPLAFATAVASIVAATTISACSKSVAEPAESHFKPTPPPPTDPGPATLQITDDVVGKGIVAKDGDKVRVHYTGTLMSGKKFDSSRDRGTPFDFTLGKGEVIKGWDQGVVGMKVGGKRRLVIPEALGYGETGSPPNIPEKAGLKFEVELLEVNPTSALPKEPGPGAGQEIDPTMMGDPDEAP